MVLAKEENENSHSITEPLLQAIMQQKRDGMDECTADTMKIRQDLKVQKRKQTQEKLEDLRKEATTNMKLAMDLAMEKGASSWLSVLPIEEFGFLLHKGAFRDAIALRYGWHISNMPKECVCGKKLTVEHVFTCSTGGFPTLRHNDIRDLTADLMAEVTSNVPSPNYNHYQGKI